MHTALGSGFKCTDWRPVELTDISLYSDYPKLGKTLKSDGPPKLSTNFIIGEVCVKLDPISEE